MSATHSWCGPIGVEAPVDQVGRGTLAPIALGVGRLLSLDGAVRTVVVGVTGLPLRSGRRQFTGGDAVCRLARAGR